MNCAYSGPPFPVVDQEQMSLLEEVCPHLAGEGRQRGLCCSTRQLRDLKTNFGIPQQFLEGLCPTCFYNFKKNFCDMTCSPDQASFIRPDHYVTGPGFDDYEGQTVTMVEDITYFANLQWVRDTYDSCKNVEVTGLGNVMNFLCGPWGAENCSPEKLFDFLGDLGNGYAPFQINYEYLMPGGGGHNPTVVPCHSQAPGVDRACPCSACPTACPAVETCATDIFFNTDGSFPASTFMCTDRLGNVIETTKPGHGHGVPAGATCLFLEEGHPGMGRYIELFCEEEGDGGHWNVTTGIF